MRTLTFLAFLLEYIEFEILWGNDLSILLFVTMLLKLNPIFYSFIFRVNYGFIYIFECCSYLHHGGFHVTVTFRAQ